MEVISEPVCGVSLTPLLMTLLIQRTMADEVEDQLSQLLEERRTLDKEAQALRSQLARAQEKVRPRAHLALLFSLEAFI